MDEALLPSPILAKATIRGNEYAWPFAYVQKTIAAAQTVGLATLGGQAQFRLPDGICEMYWLEADASYQHNESWPEYVKRSAIEVLARFQENVANADFLAEAQQWPFLREKMINGTNILDHLCFVLYFEREPGRTSIRFPSSRENSFPGHVSG